MYTAVTHLADLLQQPGHLLLCSVTGSAYNRLEHSKTPVSLQLGDLMRKVFFIAVSTHHKYDEMLTTLTSIIDRNVGTEGRMKGCYHDYCTPV